jgi:integrase
MGAHRRPSDGATAVESTENRTAHSADATDEQMHTLLAAKPKRFDDWRLHALVCLLLDTGLRIEEALTLRRSDVDFENLLITAFGKGRKERRIPFSFELRKVLFRWQGIRSKKCERSELAKASLFRFLQVGPWCQMDALVS